MNLRNSTLDTDLMKDVSQLKIAQPQIKELLESYQVVVNHGELPDELGKFLNMSEISLTVCHKYSFIQYLIRRLVVDFANLGNARQRKTSN